MNKEIDGERAHKAIIVVSGMPGSGKGTFCECARELGWSLLAFREITEQTTKELMGTSDPLAIHKVADRLRKEIGPDWVARKMVERIRNTSAKGKICVDDLRTLEELALFRRELADFTLIGILSEKETRYDRLLARRRWDDLVSRETLEQKDKGGGAWGIPDVLRAAQITIDNNGTVEEFRQKAREVLSRL